MMKWLKRRRAIKAVADLSFRDAARAVRLVERSGGKLHPKIMVALCRRARDTAPDDQHGERAAFAKRVDTYVAGRRVRYATFPTTFTTIPVPDDLREAVEDALQGDTK